MQLLKEIINYLVAFAVLITIVRMYFTVNKLWKRKSDKEVCQSISIFAYFLALAVHIPFMFKYILEENYFPAANDIVQIFSYSFILLIGTGFWVRENRTFSFRQLLLSALRFERKEAGHLVKSFIRPSGAEPILNILEKVAYLDKSLDKTEINLINEFALYWNLQIPSYEEWKVAEHTNIIDLRKSVDAYLNLMPPTNQASELIDLITLIIHADNIVAPEEELFLKEVTIMINNYVNKTEPKKMFYVLLVPQSDEQFKSVSELFPDAKLEERRGGRVFVRGTFYSKQFAEAVCKKYIPLGIFSIYEETKLLMVKN